MENQQLGGTPRIIIAVLLLLGVVAYYFWDKIQVLLGGSSPQQSPSTNRLGGSPLATDPLQASVVSPGSPAHPNTPKMGGGFVGPTGALSGVPPSGLNVSEEEAAAISAPAVVDTTTLNPNENPVLTSYLAGKAQSLNTKDVNRIVWKLGGTLAWVIRENKTDSVLWPYAEMGIEAGKNALKEYILARQSVILA